MIRSNFIVFSYTIGDRASVSNQTTISILIHNRYIILSPSIRSFLLQSNNNHILDTPIEFLPGVGPARALTLKNELQIFTFRDLLYQYPFRYIDKTQFHRIVDLTEESGAVQIKGVLRRVEILGEGKAKRLSATLRDESGVIELVWFQSIHWLEKNLFVQKEYVVYGKVSWFNNSPNLSHPEIEMVSAENTALAPTFDPVYPSTERLHQKGMDAKARRKLMRALFEKLRGAAPVDESALNLPENLPDYLTERFRLLKRAEAMLKIHFPTAPEELEAARKRLKFEELFFLQLKLLRYKLRRNEQTRGFVFDQVGDYFNDFYTNHLPFALTGAQKKVIKEIRRDMGAGKQMNRLLQGDVGSGKTIVAFLCMLIAAGNGFQSCLMAPTEILAQQHFISISALAEQIGLTVSLMTGSIKGKKREERLLNLASGAIHILIGTHALIEDEVRFQRLGLAIIDEQHRFGVEQRARLWKKSTPSPPHILVMTATPIPRTLAMTLYGDLEVSVIDELPPGRKEIITTHRNENHRLRVIGFMREEIAKGRQIYVVYPLIEESEKIDLMNLMEGYDSLSRDFPKPDYQISVVHGKMKAADKDFEMQRFIKKETQIMVATTVIEVGVNVPNASVMIVENTNRFGLSQLHQLRGRVGRGADQSFCILMTGFKLSADARERIKTMCATNNGFDIAEADLKLRGPGDLEGRMQSGVLNLHLADLAKDQRILQVARETALEILDADPHLQLPEHRRLLDYLMGMSQNEKTWARIS